MASLRLEDWALIDRVFVSSPGYVLDLSNRTFDLFFAEHGIDISDARFTAEGTSKANRLRCFVRAEASATVARLLSALLKRRRGIGELAIADADLMTQFLERLRKSVDADFFASDSRAKVGDVNSSKRRQVVLTTLGSFKTRESDPDQGHHVLPGQVLQSLTALSPQQLNDAIELLEEEGLVEVVRTLGTAPFRFSGLSLTASGRDAIELDEEKGSRMDNSVDARKVFVVHGRDEGVRDALFSFIRSLGLEPIEFTEAIQMTGSAAPYIGQALQVAFAKAQAVVVLLTGDDEARLRPEFNGGRNEPLERQARPNVLFEAGMALATHPERTVMIEVGPLRPFSDVAGRHVVRLTDGKVSERMAIAERLKAAKCEFTTSGKTDYLEKDYFAVLRNPK